MKSLLAATFTIALVLQAAAVVEAQNCATGVNCGCDDGCQGCQGSCGGQGCVGSATPCPCSADGICYPKRATWGYYQTRWGAWPGDYEDPLPTPRDQPTGAQDDGVKLDQDIPKEEEDLNAPPPSDADEEEEEGDGGAGEGEGAEGISLPPLPPLQPLTPPAGPDAPGIDPPPELPNFAPPTGAMRAPTRGLTARPPMTRPMATTSNTQRPRMKPLAVARRQAMASGPAASRAVQPAGVKSWPTGPQPPKTVRPALHQDDAPPVLPAGFTQLLQQGQVSSASHLTPTAPHRLPAAR